MDGVPGVYGAKKDLVSVPAVKRAAAKALEDHIEPDTRTAGAWADDDTCAAVKAFGARDGDGWLASGALRTAHETWARQVGDLLDRLGAEKIALRATNTVLTSADIGTGGALRKLSALDRY
ncbi:hypothetical protein JK361_13550 [Streptomyces sp. 5-8]|uniref:Uncharacterized protein n=1 Tax=Streptomyces musisoli TaxID=2802280 RepID=A0ABS1NZR7_9ACTN|nr:MULTISPECIES: hypothetical protein [Streptomyces]MBL1105597.1 hypothetical protein [Streptomyces musisoli]MBY8843492.1 hypothetical protein [Streptomyces sp. SP2-10]